MKKIITLCMYSFILSPFFFIEQSLAEQKIIQGEYQVHHSAFPSNIISPKVAALYNIKRSGNRALVNITPQKILSNGNIIGIKANLKGKARNLIGNTKMLEFQEVIEGEVIYYLAGFSFSNEETFRFDIEISPIDDTNMNTPAQIIPLKFSMKFYTE